MALTRKQAWRRVRVVRHEAAGAVEAGKTAANASARRKRPAGDWARQAASNCQQEHQPQPQQHGSPERHPSPPTRDDRSDSSGSSSSGGGGPASPERNVLDNWRLPREGRDPSARPGASAARRQAAAACVRVGSRVSFNTVVAAILIPSAKDLHAAAREELWWQETDYRDFRINFIQFMRTPPAAAADGPELVPVEIVAESESTPGEDEDEETAEAAQESVQQPVVVDPAVYEGARATEKVCAWPVQEEEIDEPEDPVVPATAAAAAAAAASTAVVVVTSEPKKSMSAFSLSDSDDTSPPTPPSEEPGTDGGESDESIETAAGISCATATGIPCSAAAASCAEPPLPSSSSFPAMAAPSPRVDSNAVGFSAGDGEVADRPTASAAGGADGGLSASGGDRGEQETNPRGRVDSGSSSSSSSSSVACSLGWSSAEDEGNDADEEEEEEPDYDGNTMRMGRSFSNLETARRGGAGLSAVIPGDSDDGDESSDDSEMGGRGGRPRALSLDGWFTCGLENGVDTKTYETHDHAGRLRDLVLLAPIPAVCATPPTDSAPTQQVELNAALRRLGVTFNVSVDKGETPNAADESTPAVGGKAQVRAEGGEAVSPGGFFSSPASAAARRKIATSPSPVRPRPMASVKSLKGIGPDGGSRDSLTTPVGLRVS
eukprot:g8227.t1